jgi:biopolymer transport protein ExbB
VNSAIALCENERSSMGRIYGQGLKVISRPMSEMDRHMEDAASIELSAMESKWGVLGIIAGIAPMLGFIGTISGVIKIFYSISQTEDISIGNISGGLYEKMISSGAGLVVGIIAYSAYHLYNGRIDSFTLAIQKQVLDFVNIIQRPNGKTK